MPDTTVNIGALYAALDRERQRRGYSWRELGRRLGLASSAFTRMAGGRRPDVDAFATMVLWLGIPAENFMDSSAAHKAGRGR